MPWNSTFAHEMLIPISLLARFKSIVHTNLSKIRLTVAGKNYSWAKDSLASP